MSAQPHGYNRYKRGGCRCIICRSANANRSLAYRAGNPTREWMPVEPVARHLQLLGEANVGLLTVQARSGVPRQTLQAWKARQADRVLKELADRVLAVEPVPVVRWPDATGTHRRIQALVAIGHPISELAAATGRNTRKLNQILTRPRVRYTTVAEIRDLYDRLSMQIPAGSPKTRAACEHARRNGWFKPLAWDDDTIDDPNSIPAVLPADGDDLEPADELLVQQWTAGFTVELTPVHRATITRRLRGSLPQNEIAAKLGVSTAAVYHYLYGRTRGRAVAA